jgi:hypothetical protein
MIELFYALSALTFSMPQVLLPIHQTKGEEKTPNLGTIGVMSDP